MARFGKGESLAVFAAAISKEGGPNGRDYRPAARAILGEGPEKRVFNLIRKRRLAAAMPNGKGREKP